MKVSSSNRPPIPKTEERPIHQNRQAQSYSRLSPEQKRNDAIARKPAPRIKTLGGRIDVRA